MRQQSIQTMVWIAILTTWSIVGAMIKVPIPFVPFTLQITAVFIGAALFGAKVGAMSQLLYIAIGLAGFPVFAAGGGLGYVIVPTFGYLVGFAVAGWYVGWTVPRLKRPTYGKIVLHQVIGVVLLYIVGSVWMWANINFIGGETTMTLGHAFLYGFLIPMPGDVLLAFVCASVVLRLQPIMERSMMKGVA